MSRPFRLSPSKSIILGTTLCVGLILVSSTSIPLAYAPEQDYLAALKFVETREKPSDAIVTVGLATLTYKNFYKMDWEDVKTFPGTL